MGRPKGSKNRNPQIILYQRRSIARFYLKGMSQATIARRVNLTDHQVSDELVVLREQWKQSAEIDFTMAQGAALDRIDDLEQEAINQYIRSKRPRKTTTRKREPKSIPTDKPSKVNNKGDIIPPDPEFVMVEESIRTEEGTGSIRWHDQILKCIDMRLKILGLYKQTNKEGFDGATIPVNISQETIKGRTALLLAIIKEWESSGSGN